MKVSVFWTDRTADSTAFDAAASDTATSDTIASDIVASDIVASDIVASDIVASNRTVTNNAGLDMTSSNIAGILSWNTVVTADWNPDNSQSVYKGE